MGLPNYTTMKDPLKFQQTLWPGVRFYREQQEIIYSIEDSIETYVPAGNKLGV